jgi:hypothetical protein
VLIVLVFIGISKKEISSTASGFKLVCRIELKVGVLPLTNGTERKVRILIS